LEASPFARFCFAPAMRQLRHLELQSFNAERTAENYDAAFSALAQLESLRLTGVQRVDVMMPHLAHAPALRTLTIACAAECPDGADTYGARHPSRDVLYQLLTAAPRLEVLLEVAASIEEWCDYFWYQQDVFFSDEPAAYREQLDEQWRELQRMGAEMERVTVVEPVLSWFLSLQPITSCPRRILHR
jgi:hypothetical protein